MSKNILDKIVAWATGEPEIKALILTGSRANPDSKQVDALSDFDIALFTTDTNKYTSNDSWMRNIEDVWVYIPAKIEFLNHTLPTRLIVFKDGVSVDLSFHSMDLLKELTDQQKLPFACNFGCKILLDKDNLAKNLPKAPMKNDLTPKPSQQEFLSAINVFFFEVYEISKSLARQGNGNLWHVKLRDNTTKEYLLTMIEWHEKSVHGWDYNTSWYGKKMKSWVDPATWQALHKVFGHFDNQDSWDALMATVELFRKLAKQTAKNLNFEYPEDVDKNIIGFVKELKEAQK